MVKRFFIELSFEDRIRVVLKINKNHVSDFVVQYETWIDDWKPVVRYDFSHGMPHRDFMMTDGRQVKEWLYGKTPEEVVNESIDDLKKNWHKYLKRCGYEKEN